MAHRVLIANTLAFTVCFAVWTMYGVLITFLVDHQLLHIDKVQVGWLLGIPILTGSLFRLPVGMLTDRYGGKPVYLGVLSIAAVSVYLTSYATSFAEFMIGGLCFGISGAAFAVGIAYSSVWFPRERQGTALGIFGIGNAGAALTTLGAPHLLNKFTEGGTRLDGWRMLPQLYAGALVVTALVFALVTQNKRTTGDVRSWNVMLQPLKQVRVWRFGLYYFLVFGAFVALSQWLVPYYVNVYGMTLATAGLLASIFSLPSGLIRALGGWLSDRIGARRTMYWVLGSCAVLFALLVAPRMDIRSPGEGIMSDRAGTVESVTPQTVVVDGQSFQLKGAGESVSPARPEGDLVWPTVRAWQEPAVVVGQKVAKKELLARGVTHIYFQANVWVFTALVFVAGIMMGIGKAAVYKHIPEYFPQDVGVVGGIVGVIGGLGGFVSPILFGWMLKHTGLWTTCWMFLALVSAICLVWMHRVVMAMGHRASFEHGHTLAEADSEHKDQGAGSGLTPVGSTVGPAK